MSESGWPNQLGDLIAKQAGDGRVVVIGLGHPLKGDDYVGSLVAKDLRNKVKSNSRIVIIDAEDSPENVISILTDTHPRLVVLIDSIKAGLDPGSVTLMDLSETTYPFFGTHSIPLKLLFEMAPEIHKTVLLGIQPASFEIGEPLSREVAEAEAHVVMVLGDILRKVQG